MGKIRVLIIDDSALVRDILEKGLSSDPQIEVVGKASDVYVARDKIVMLKPDVLTLDIEMPRMDGIEFLRKLMPQYPLPVIIVSSMSSEGSQVTLDALQAGAVDFVLKPSTRVSGALNAMMHELIDKVKTAATVDVSRFRKENYAADNRPVSNRILHGSTDKVIAVGASTGGTVALTRIIEKLPSDIPGMVVVQHMPPVFTRLFAESLSENARVAVKEACDGDRILTGQVLIAPGDYQMEVYRSGGYYYVKCYKGEKVNGHSPSVDVLFHSAAREAGVNAVGIILTGMGRDGAQGLLDMKKNGAVTIGQDEASCVVYGMPKEAYKLGAVDHVVSLDQVADKLIQVINSGIREA